jgi:UDP-GlcNAc3NAcA epimerase
LLCCSTRTAVENLRGEGVRGRVIRSGDVMLELIRSRRRDIEQRRRLLERFGLEEKQYVLLTVHRPSTTDSPEDLARLPEVCRAANLPVLFPVHPRTRKMLRGAGLLGRMRKLTDVIVTDPLDYLDSLAAAKFARAVLTDSGGLQKEALYLGTPVLTLRTETEWLETLKLGNHLVGLDARRIRRILSGEMKVGRMNYLLRRRAASEIIVENIMRRLRVE